MAKHPAPFSDQIIPVLAELLGEHLNHDRFVDGSPLPLVLDPFAGVGRIHQLRPLGYETIGVELEEPWANQSPYTRVGNALDLDFDDEAFDAVVTSPVYGNRMSDHHVARDKSYRRTYKHYLGRDLSEGNAGVLQWGQEYRDFHHKAWSEVHRVLVLGGIFLLNIKDHQRDKKRAHVANWHYGCLLSLGFKLVDIRRVATPGFRYGENREVRYPERVLVFRKDSEHVTSLHSMPDAA